MQKESLIHICDNTSARWLKIFCIFRSGAGSRGGVSYIVYGSIKRAAPYTRKKLNLLKLIKGQKLQALLIRLRTQIWRLDGMNLVGAENSGILLRSRILTRGWHIKGPAAREVGRRKLALYIKELI